MSDKWNEARWGEARWLRPEGWACSCRHAVWGRTKWAASAPVEPPQTPAPPVPAPVPTPPPTTPPAPLPRPPAPFTVVSERWSGLSSFWACTHCAGVMGRRWETWERGNCPPPTRQEVEALARASGDPDPHGGSNTRELIRGVANRYHRTWRSGSITRSSFIRAATTPGSLLVIGLTAGELPSSMRRELGYGSFTGGHRTVIGCQKAGETRIWDPMSQQGSRGVVVDPAKVWPAVWTGEVIGPLRRP